MTFTTVTFSTSAGFTVTTQSRSVSDCSVVTDAEKLRHHTGNKQVFTQSPQSLCLAAFLYVYSPSKEGVDYIPRGESLYSDSFITRPAGYKPPVWLKNKRTQQEVEKTSSRKHKPTDLLSFRRESSMLWYSLPETVVAAPTLNSFKSRLDRTIWKPHMYEESEEWYSNPHP